MALSWAARSYLQSLCDLRREHLESQHSFKTLMPTWKAKQPFVNRCFSSHNSFKARALPEERLFGKPMFTNGCLAFQAVLKGCRKLWLFRRYLFEVHDTVAILGIWEVIIKALKRMPHSSGQLQVGSSIEGLWKGYKGVVYGYIPGA